MMPTKGWEIAHWDDWDWSFFHETDRGYFAVKKVEMAMLMTQIDTAKALGWQDLVDVLTAQLVHIIF